MSAIARLVAVVAGIAGILLCALVPLLPVRQTTATIAWPQAPGPNGMISDITAPLVSGAPQALDITIPCQAIATLPAEGGLALSTVPREANDATKGGLFVRATADTVFVAFRDTVAAAAPRPAVAAGNCSTLHIWANVGQVGADFVGIPGAAGTLEPEKKPQVAGIFTDLKVPAEPGLSARIDVDTRFITSPTTLKLAVMALGVISVLASIVALALLDRTAGRRVPTAWRRFFRAGPITWLTDVGVIGTLLLWHVIGATTSDDGYNLTIARVTADAGYTPNYYRFFGATEAPFDWYQSVLAHLAAISTAGVWMRLPATAAAIATWLIISRCVLPRLGRRIALNRVAVLTAGAVFLAAWLPFNNGLRPEPVIAFGTIAAWVLVENAIGTRRLWPAARGDRHRGVQRDDRTAGAHRAGPDPGRRQGHCPQHRDPQARRRRAGPDRPACGVAVADLRDRLPGPDAGHRRRVRPHQVRRRTDHRLVPGVPALLLPHRRGQRRLVGDPPVRRAGDVALSVRDDRRAAAPRKPARRRIGSGVAADRHHRDRAAVVDLHADEVGRAVRRVRRVWRAHLERSPRSSFARVGLQNRRNLAVYVTALLFMLAWATSGINAWFYVGNYGVPWFDKQPVIAGVPVTFIFLALAIATGLLAGWLHFRMDYAGHTEVANTGRNRALASTPLLVVAVIMVVLEVGSMAKGAAQRYPVYTTAKANVEALTSGLSSTSCAMADDVLVEPDTNAGMLQPVPGQRFGQYGPLGGAEPGRVQPERRQRHPGARRARRRPIRER